jgi:hypothetical protein
MLDLDEQVYRLRRRVVDGYRKRPYARPIRRLFDRADCQLHPVGSREIHSRRYTAGIDACSGDLGETRVFDRDARASGRIAEADDRVRLLFRPPRLQHRPNSGQNKKEGQLPDHWLPF